MSAISELVEYWNRKVKRFTIWDVKLVQVASAMLMLIIVKVFPGIMNLDVWWFVAIALACVPRLAYVLWIKSNGQPNVPGDARQRA